MTTPFASRSLRDVKCRPSGFSSWLLVFANDFLGASLRERTTTRLHLGFKAQSREQPVRWKLRGRWAAALFPHVCPLVALALTGAAAALPRAR
eukprot:scaffold886_cov249-Pinguiococcus_pyrenoidosus.AAC.13